MLAWKHLSISLPFPFSIAHPFEAGYFSLYPPHSNIKKSQRQGLRTESLRIWDLLRRGQHRIQPRPLRMSVYVYKDTWAIKSKRTCMSIIRCLFARAVKPINRLPRESAQRRMEMNSVVEARYSFRCDMRNKSDWARFLYLRFHPRWCSNCFQRYTLLFQWTISSFLPWRFWGRQWADQSLLPYFQVRYVKTYQNDPKEVVVQEIVKSRYLKGAN